MNRAEIARLIEGIVRKYERYDDWPIELLKTPRPEPSAVDWQVLEDRLGCKFPPSLIDYVSVMCSYDEPGHLVPVRIDGDDCDTIAGAYDAAMASGSWNPDLVPFNDSYGDYFCLSASAGAQSPVYFARHGLPADQAVEQVAGSFDEWLASLEGHLGGELIGRGSPGAAASSLDRRTRQRLSQASNVWAHWFPSLFRR